MRRKIRISAEQVEQFKKLRESGARLPKEAPLMPSIRTGGFRRNMKLLSEIKKLPAGTKLLFEKVKMRGNKPWYYVTVDGSAVCGWINSIIFE